MLRKEPLLPVARPYVCLALALAVACLGACTPRSDGVAWHTLIAPYATGHVVVRGYVLGAPTRGRESDVVVVATAGDGLCVPVHVVDRGRWQGVRETRSFGVAWEAPHTTAPRDDAEAVTEALAVAIRRNDVRPLRATEIALDEAPRSSVRRVLGYLAYVGTGRALPLWMPAVLLLLLGCWRHGLTPSRTDVGLLASAAMLRVITGAWGPFHVNGQGALWMIGVHHPNELRAYGPGWHEIHGATARVLAPDHAVYVDNLVLSSFVPLLVASLARRAGLDATRGFLAGALVAVDGSLLRIAATESYFSALVALTLGAAWCFTHTRQGVMLVAGALLAAQCARVHPLGCASLALVAPLVFVCVRWRAALEAAALTCVAVLLTSGSVLAEVIGHVLDGHLMRPALSWVHVLPGVAAVALCLAHAPTRRAAPAVAVALLLAAAIAVTYTQSDVWRAAALRVALVPVLFVVCALTPDAFVRRRGLCVMAVCAWLVAGADTVRQRSTDDHEFHLVKRWLRRVSRECTVSWVALAGPRRVVFLPSWAHGGRWVALDARDEVNVAARLDGRGCAWYVRVSACETPDGFPACARVERALRLREVHAATLPAMASHRGLPYTSPSVTVRFYALDGIRAPGR